MIKESYVSFETAKLLKEAGFGVPTCKHYTRSGAIWTSAVPEKYNDNLDYICFPCSTQALAARWLREVHDTFVKVELVTGTFDGQFCVYWSFDTYTVSTGTLGSFGDKYDTYEEALEAGITLVLKWIINEKQ